MKRELPRNQRAAHPERNGQARVTGGRSPSRWADSPTCPAANPDNGGIFSHPPPLQRVAVGRTARLLLVARAGGRRQRPSRWHTARAVEYRSFQRTRRTRDGAISERASAPTRPRAIRGGGGRKGRAAHTEKAGYRVRRRVEVRRQDREGVDGETLSADPGHSRPCRDGLNGEWNLEGPLECGTMSPRRRGQTCITRKTRELQPRRLLLGTKAGSSGQSLAARGGCRCSKELRCHSRLQHSDLSSGASSWREARRARRITAPTAPRSLLFWCFWLNLKVDMGVDFRFVLSRKIDRQNPYTFFLLFLVSD